MLDKETHKSTENVLLICFFSDYNKKLVHQVVICTVYDLKKSFSFEQKLFSDECSIVKNSQVNVYFQPI